MLRNTSAISRISFEAPEDTERAAVRRAFAGSSPGRSSSGLSQFSEASEQDEWEAWRVS